VLRDIWAFLGEEKNVLIMIRHIAKIARRNLRTAMHVLCVMPFAFGMITADLSSFYDGACFSEPGAEDARCSMACCEDRKGPCCCRTGEEASEDAPLTALSIAEADEERMVATGSCLYSSTQSFAFAFLWPTQESPHTASALPQKHGHSQPAPTWAQYHLRGPPSLL
jgi:hypothetical protein